MNQETNTQQELLQKRFDRLLAATLLVRSAQNAYYGFRASCPADVERKRALLQDSKSKEKELDRILSEETKLLTQPALF